MTAPDIYRDNNFIPTKGLENTGLKDPIHKKPLYKVGHIDELYPDQVTYVTERDGRNQQTYTKDIKAPYFKTHWNNVNEKWHGTKIRYFVPGTDGIWEEYKTHFVWSGSIPTIYLPIDMPEDEVRSILDILEKENNNSGIFGNNIMPIAARVASKTIGMDLVAVTPMPVPKMNLMYLDFVYPGSKSQPWYEEIPKKRKKIIRLINKKNGTDRSIPGRKSRIHIYKRGKRWNRNPYTPLL